MPAVGRDDTAVHLARAASLMMVYAACSRSRRRCSSRNHRVSSRVRRRRRPLTTLVCVGRCVDATCMHQGSLGFCDLGLTHGPEDHVPQRRADAEVAGRVGIVMAKCSRFRVHIHAGVGTWCGGRQNRSCRRRGSPSQIRRTRPMRQTQARRGTGGRKEKASGMLTDGGMTRRVESLG